MKVSLVGAGPGDPGLLTIRGKELIAEADVVVYDALANPAFLADARPDAELIYAGKISDQHTLPQDRINELLAKKALEGKNVVRLKGGDPYIFGRGGEEGEYLAARGIPFEEAPGVSSAVAAPAYAGIPLTHRDLTSSLTILTGHEKYKAAGSAHNWEALARSGSTLVILMGMANLPEIVANLVGAGMDENTPAAVVYRGTTPMQKVATAPLAKIAAAAKEAGLANPSVVVIGKVVSMRETLDWFSKKPLLGKRIIVTRAREQASGLAKSLTELGAETLECPAIKIAPLADYSAIDSAIDNLPAYKWLIFTSANGVKYFWQRLEAKDRDSRALGAAKVAAIGPGTADALRAKGVIADFTPSAYVAEEVASQLIKREGSALAGQKILLPRATKTRTVLEETLMEAKAAVDPIPVYDTVTGEGCDEEVIRLLNEGKIDCVTFGSSSSATNFLKIASPETLGSHPETLLAAIGPVTAKTLEERGLKVAIQAEQFSIPGLVAAIVNYYASMAEKQC